MVGMKTVLRTHCRRCNRALPILTKLLKTHTLGKNSLTAERQYLLNDSQVRELHVEKNSMVVHTDLDEELIHGR